MTDKKKNLTESLEDYLEAIYDLVHAQGKATVSETAERLSVAKPSVVKALKRLRELKLVVQEPYSEISLTPAGRKEAEFVRLRHNALVYFLTDFLGLDYKSAETNACALEHHLCERSTERLLAFIELNYENVVRVVEGKNFENGSFLKRTVQRRPKESTADE
jgi:DtxR family Mn-dependent transcriptional regulator